MPDSFATAHQLREANIQNGNMYCSCSNPKLHSQMKWSITVSGNLVKIIHNPFVFTFTRPKHHWWTILGPMVSGVFCLFLSYAATIWLAVCQSYTLNRTCGTQSHVIFTWIYRMLVNEICNQTVEVRLHAFQFHVSLLMVKSSTTV